MLTWPKSDTYTSAPATMVARLSPVSRRWAAIPSKDEAACLLNEPSRTRLGSPPLSAHEARTDFSMDSSNARCVPSVAAAWIPPENAVELPPVPRE
jgi:hypothetical protein